jgi:carbon-monoxide dehydrogenase small subunit
MSSSVALSEKRKIRFTVNGETRNALAFPMERLLDVLRDEFSLTGTKEGCGEGECGACSVLLNGVLVNSCLIPVLQVEDADILTIEGLSRNPRFHALQRAFLECGAAQCGICTPGMMLASAHLLEQNPTPTLKEIREALSGNLCRCTGYMQIFEAVRRASESITRA